MQSLRSHILVLCALLPTIVLSGCALNEDKRQQARRQSGGQEIRKAQVVGEPGGGTMAGVPGSRSRVVSVDECVRFALEKNFSIRMARAAEKAASADLVRAKAAFDPAIGGSIVTSEQNDGGWDGPTGSGGIEKKFTTGTEVRVEAGDVYTRTGDFRDDYLDVGQQSDFTLTVRQPLLRGGWGVNRSGIKLATLLKEQATATKTAEVLDMLRASETAYWAAAVAGEMLERQQHSLQRAEKLHADVKARLDAGDASQLDLLEADVALAGAQERLVTAEKAAADRLDELWFVLGVPVKDRRKGISFGDAGEAAIIREKPDPEGSIVRALTQSPAAVLLVNEVARRNVELSRAKNGLLPQVDLEFGLDHVQEESITGSDGIKKTLPSGYDAVALLRVSMPLTFRAERAELAKAKAELERSQAAREQAELRLRQRIAELCRALESGQESLRVAKVSLSAHRKKLDEQVRRHAEGLLSTHDLRLAQEEMETAEMRELQARLALLGNQASLGQLEGTLAGRHGITL